MIIFLIILIFILAFALILLTFTSFKEEKYNCFDVAKMLCLIIPTIMSIVIMYAVFSNIDRGVVNGIDAGGVAIFGILASVWVGLNIYNVVEKKSYRN